jgi:hypothetical protein
MGSAPDLQVLRLSLRLALRKHVSIIFLDNCAYVLVRPTYVYVGFVFTLNKTLVRHGGGDERRVSTSAFFGTAVSKEVWFLGFRFLRSLLWALYIHHTSLLAIVGNIATY